MEGLVNDRANGHVSSGLDVGDQEQSWKWLEVRGYE